MPPPCRSPSARETALPHPPGSSPLSPRLSTVVPVLIFTSPRPLQLLRPASAHRVAECAPRRRPPPPLRQSGAAPAAPRSTHPPSGSCGSPATPPPCAPLNIPSSRSRLALAIRLPYRRQIQRRRVRRHSPSALAFFAAVDLLRRPCKLRTRPPGLDILPAHHPTSPSPAPRSSPSPAAAATLSARSRPQCHRPFTQRRTRRLLHPRIAQPDVHHRPALDLPQHAPPRQLPAIAAATSAAPTPPRHRTAAHIPSPQIRPRQSAAALRPTPASPAAASPASPVTAGAPSRLSLPPPCPSPTFIFSRRTLHSSAASASSRRLHRHLRQHQRRA